MKSSHRNSMRRAGSRAAVLIAGVTAVVIGFASSAMAGPDTVSDTPMATTTFNGEVFSVAYAGNTIYVGGTFTKAIAPNSHGTSRPGLAAIDAASGALLPWNPTANGEVRTLAVDGTNVYAGGDFTTINGVTQTHIAEIDGVTGALSTTFTHSTNGEVRAMTVGNGNLYVGGSFTAVDGATVGYLSAFDLITGARNTAWAPVADERVDSMAYANNLVYIGGKYAHINGAANPRLRAFNPSTGTVVTTFKPAAPYEVYSVAVGASGVYGALGGPGGRAMAFSLTGATQWAITTDGDSQAVATMDQTVYVGGHFDNVCNSPLTGVMGTCSDGSTHRGKLFATDLAGNLLSWNPNGDGIEGTHQIAVNTTLHTVAAVGQWADLNGVYHPGFAEVS